MDEILKRLFETLLVEAQTDYPGLGFDTCCRAARDASIEALSQRMHSIAEERIAGHHELVNRLHFECRS